MTKDFVAIIEAAYAPVDSEQLWLQGIADATLACLDAGLGVNAYTYDATNPHDFRVGACASAGNTGMDGASIEALVRSGTPELVTRAYEPGPPMYFSQFASSLEADGVPDVSATRKKMADHGLPDVLAVRGSDVCMKGSIVTVSWPARGRLSSRRTRILTCVGAHLASGWRLRQAAKPASSADAVLDPQGRLLDAFAEDAVAKRQRFFDAVKARAQARGSLRSQDPPAAVALWRAMVDGEWTLVDHIDSDGKRFVLARRNRPGMGHPGALTLRERQVATYASFGFSLKHVGYELGLSASTVTECLKSALRKLRLENRAQLVALARGG